MKLVTLTAVVKDDWSPTDIVHELEVDSPFLGLRCEEAGPNPKGASQIYASNTDPDYAEISKLLGVSS